MFARRIQRTTIHRFGEIYLFFNTFRGFFLFLIFSEKLLRKSEIVIIKKKNHRNYRMRFFAFDFRSDEVLCVRSNNSLKWKTVIEYLQLDDSCIPRSTRKCNYKLGVVLNVFFFLIRKYQDWPPDMWRMHCHYKMNRYSAIRVVAR